MYKQADKNKIVPEELVDKKQPTPNANNEFLIGFANSIFQTSGDSCGETNWSDAADKGSVVPVLLGQSISHWDNFEDDLDKMQALGVNSYRFSIEWGHIEPEKGRYDEAVLKRYDEMVAACIARNIKPMLTLYHFNEPYWLAELHSFEKEENIQYFVNFSEMIFKRYSSHVTLWCTINEPACLAFSGYFYGQFPPHKHSLKKTINFLLNLLKAHVQVYEKLKSLPNGNKAEIGIVHNVVRFVPRYAKEPISKWVAKFLTKITDDLVVNFLRTGKYDYKVTGIVNTHYTNPSAPQSFDFVGLNFYGNVVIGFNKKNIFGPTHFPDQTMGHFYLPIDPAGFDAAISEIAALGKPIYITETGHATDDDNARIKCLNEYFEVLEKNLAENIDIRGLYVWTFADSYEWNEGHAIKFGLCDQYRVERASAKVFKQHIHEVLAKEKR